MMDRMVALSRFLYRFSRWWVVLLGFVVFIGFSALTLPGQNAIVAEYSQGSGSPDTSLFYSAEQLYHMADVYGQEGRTAYLNARWTFDVAFPLIYTFFLVSAISWLLNQSLPVGSRWRLVNLVPLAAMGLDFLENTAASVVMARYPLHCPLAEWLAPVFTLLKWLLVGGSLVILLAAIFLVLLRRIRKNA
jgi:hypothetical protein